MTFTDIRTMVRSGIFQNDCKLTYLESNGETKGKVISGYDYFLSVCTDIIKDYLNRQLIELSTDVFTFVHETLQKFSCTPSGSVSLEKVDCLEGHLLSLKYQKELNNLLKIMGG